MRQDPEKEMKTRNGFVSNSSSSSFVIALPKKLEWWKLADILYPTDAEGKKPGVTTPYDWHHDVDYNSATTLITQQIENQKPLTKSQLIKEIASGYFDGRPDWPFNGRADEIRKEYHEATGKNFYDDDTPKAWKDRHEKVQQQEWDQYDKDTLKAATKLANEMLKGPFKGKNLFVCSFSDNDGGIFTVMEHGDTFRNVPHIRISHH